MDAFLDLLAAWGRWAAATGGRPVRGGARGPLASASALMAPPGARETPEGDEGGAKAPPNATPNATVCPEDGTPLLNGPEPFDGVRVCPRCLGCFLPPPLVRALVRSPERFEGVEALVPTVDVGPDPLRYRKCPECRQLMARRNFEKVSGIIVDACPRHGTWFDAGELEAARAFVRAGGREEREAFEAREAAWQSRQSETMREWDRRFRDASSSTWGEPGAWDDPGSWG